MTEGVAEEATSSSCRLSSSSNIRSDETDVTENHPTSNHTERIYVGGFQPPLLKRSKFLKRLQDTLGSKLKIQPDMKGSGDDDTACFVHLDVRVKDSNDSKSLEPQLCGKEQIAKLYHNVTWKQCKLRVEFAKPHFLDRLRQERAEREEAIRQQQPTLEEETAHVAKDEPASAPAACQRRHLRIRERYGEQVFSVDTKPYAVESWRDMHALLHKIDKRRTHFLQEYRQQQKKSRHQNNPFVTQQQQQHDNSSALEPEKSVVYNIRTQSKLNRAVHLRFSSEMDETVNGRSRLAGSKASNIQPDLEPFISDDESSASLPSSNSSENSASHQKDDKDEGTASVTSKNYGGSSDESENDDKPKNSDGEAAYVWSDSDNDSSDDDSISPANEKDEKGRHIIQKQYQSSNDESDSNSGSNGEPNKPSTKSVENSHTWEEFESGESDLEENKKKANMPPKLPSAFDEFESAMDIEGNDPVDENSDPTGAKIMLESNVELREDVETNLGLLASLFPDMKKPEPRRVAGDEENSGDGSANRKSGTNGWTAGGIMMRFDPRKAPIASSTTKADTKVAGKKEEEEAATSSEEEEGGESLGLEETEKGDGDKGQSENDSGSSEDDEDKIISTASNAVDNDKGMAAASDDNQTQDIPKLEVVEGNVYKQETLENVFREARERVASSAPVTVQTTESQDGSTGGFSFGFDLGSADKNDPIEATTASDGFSFGFFPSERKQDAIKAVDATTPKSTDPTNTADQDEETKDNTTAITGFRRRGMLFPQEVLDRYQEDFYLMNDGLKILQDLDRYRRDPVVKEHWQHERQTLTQDWKRKRKYAQQSRNKHQKHSKHHSYRN